MNPLLSAPTTAVVLPPPYPPTSCPGLDPVIGDLGWDVGPPRRVILPTGEQAWLVTTFADVETVMSDRRFSRARASEDRGARFAGVAPPVGSLLAVDPPDHTRLRTLVSAAFTRRRVEDMRSSIEGVVDQLLDAVLTAGAGGRPVDLVPQLCLPLPITVVCRLLGVPEASFGQVREWSAAFLSTSSGDRAATGRAAGALAAFLGALAAERASELQDDLLSALVQAADGSDRLSQQELVSLSIAILVAGYETTSAELTNAIWLILSDPGRVQWLREDLGRVPRAVEEILRWVSLGSSGGFPRIALSDAQVGGTLIRAGEAVVPAIDAANRDPAIFEDPDQLRWDRAPSATMAFGHGLHYCLGAQLARLELEVGLTRLLEAFPDLALAQPDSPPRWRFGTMVRTLDELPVVLS